MLFSRHSLIPACSSHRVTVFAFVQKYSSTEAKVLLKGIHIFKWAWEKPWLWQPITWVKWPTRHGCCSTEPQGLCPQILQGPGSTEHGVLWKASFEKGDVFFLFSFFPLKRWWLLQLPNANSLIMTPVTDSEVKFKAWFHEPLQIPQLYYDLRWRTLRDLFHSLP